LHSLLQHPIETPRSRKSVDVLLGCCSEPAPRRTMHLDPKPVRTTRTTKDQRPKTAKPPIWQTGSHPLASCREIRFVPPSPILSSYHLILPYDDILSWKDPSNFGGWGLQEFCTSRLKLEYVISNVIEGDGSRGNIDGRSAISIELPWCRRMLFTEASELPLEVINDALDIVRPIAVAGHKLV